MRLFLTSIPAIVATGILVMTSPLVEAKSSSNKEREKIIKMFQKDAPKKNVKSVKAVNTKKVSKEETKKLQKVTSTKPIKEVKQTSIKQTSGKTVKASWYGPGFHGKRTASGERYNQNALTAAHNSYPFGTKLKVTHDGKSTIVEVNDRGAFNKYGRTIDLSKGAAQSIGCYSKGVCNVTYKVVSKPTTPWKYQPM